MRTSSLGLLKYLRRFIMAFTAQVTSDDKRWEDEWKKRGRAGQEKRFKDRIQVMYDEYVMHGTPIPWLKVAGEAFIGWVRETFPDFATRMSFDDLEDEEMVAPI